jgi:hypothetical protein
MNIQIRTGKMAMEDRFWFGGVNGGGSAEGTPTSGECDRMIWHHCRRFGVSACKYVADPIRGRLFNFVQYAYSAGRQLRATRPSRGSVTLSTLLLQPN